MIYLDNAGTTRVYDEAMEAMKEVYSNTFFNPSSTYKDALAVKKLISESRAVIAQKLGCAPNEIYFTSCATESNNWALTSGFKNKRGNLVVSSGEHACVYECAKNLKNKGFDVRFAPLNSDGTVSLPALLSLVDENTCLVSVIHTSNETGVINDIESISRAVKAKNKNVIMHSDGVQAYLKTNCSVRKLGVDLYSVSGHKIGAPKGIGALYVNSKIKLQPLLFGGGQESGMRSGTENVGGIVALAKATQIYAQSSSEEMLKRRDLLVNLLKEIDDVTILSESATRSHSIVTVVALNTKAEILQTMCADDGVIIGRGSACASHHSGNRVLSEMGLTQRQIDGAIRISLSPQTSDEDIRQAVRIIDKNITKLRGHNIG